MQKSTDRKWQVDHRLPISGKIVVPPLAISSNIDFLLHEGRRILVFAGGEEREVESVREVEKDEMKELIKKIYKITLLSWTEMWKKRICHVSDWGFEIKIKII